MYVALRKWAQGPLWDPLLSSFCKDSNKDKRGRHIKVMTDSEPETESNVSNPRQMPRSTHGSGRGGSVGWMEKYCLKPEGRL